MPDLTSLFWLFLLFFVGFYIRRALMARESAFIAARRHCETMGVQLLDQNVYLRRIWFRRNDAGRLSLWRAFYFDFTVRGDDRYLGRVIMLGKQVTAVQLDPHKFH